jgi:hypothetical protein
MLHGHEEKPFGSHPTEHGRDDAVARELAQRVIQLAARLVDGWAGVTGLASNGFSLTGDGGMKGR